MSNSFHLTKSLKKRIQSINLPGNPKLTHKQNRSSVGFLFIKEYVPYFHKTSFYKYLRNKIRIHETTEVHGRLLTPGAVGRIVAPAALLVSN